MMSPRLASLLCFLLTSPGCHLSFAADDKKAFESCMSKCVYEATKITKGVGQVEVMGRTEAFAACKPKCAKSKKDLSRGGSRDTVNLNEDGTRKE